MQYGALPELHGQNILLSFEDGRVQKCVLRDHDTVRIYKPWLTASAFIAEVCRQRRYT